MLRSINDLPDVKGVRVLMRAALNAPVENGVVTDGYRLEKTLATVTELLHKGARVILVSHLSVKGASLRPIYEYMQKKVPLTFSEDIVGPSARKAVDALQDGQALMLENVRLNAGEEANDEHFAREMASLGDVYVNDAFDVAHRNHAGIVGIPKFLPSYAGLQFMAEVEGLTPALSPQSPSLAVIGGAKFSTKSALIHTLLAKYDKLFIGGAIVNDFFKAKGYEVGKSLVSDPERVRPLLDNSKIILATDVVIENANGRDTRDVADVHANDFIYDIGPKSIAALAGTIEKSKTVLWNGPMGNFEKGFVEQTDELAKLIANAKGQTIVGGGDTLASIQNLGIMDKFTFVSTAGGAMLDFLANGTLPGIEAIKNSKSL